MTCFQALISTRVPTKVPSQNEALQNEITRLAGHINAANYRFLKLLAALVERKAWFGAGIKSPVHWLNIYCGISAGPAREKVRVALALKDLPLIGGAFSRGEISYSKVRAMTRMATPKNEDHLLMIAKHGTASHLEKLVRQFQYTQRLAGDDHGKAQQDARQFSCHYDDDGMLVFRGKLAPEDGALFMKAMDAVLDTMCKERFQRDRDEEAKTDSAETFANDHEPTFPQKRADALVRMAEQSLRGKSGGNGGDKYQVVVHLHANDSHGPHGPHAHLEDGPVLCPKTVRKLADDAALVPVLEDDDGKVLNVGRKTRTIPPAIRRALALRDRGCRFPGCCDAKFVDAHHIKHWCDGGETKLDNLLLLCRHHHRLLHEEKYRIERDESGSPVFMDDKGREIRQAIYPQFEPGPVSAETGLAIEREHEVMGLAIDERTAVTAWLGERMDYGMGVEGLLKRVD